MNPSELPPPLQVLQMMMGHWVGQILGTVAELGIADVLAKGPCDADAIAAAVKSNPDATHRMLRAAASVGILHQDGKRFALTPLGDCLRSDSPFGLRDLVVAELAPGHWLPWGRLRDAVMTGQPQAKAALGVEPWTYYAKNPTEGAWFARGMGNLSKMAAIDVTSVHDFSAHATICDVGGSQGALIAEVLRRSPKSRGVIFDRPDVVAEAATAVKAYGLGDRLTTQGGDFFESVPAADAYLLKHILHDWDDARATAILKTVGRAAKPGATVYLVEMLLGDSPMATPVNLMDLNMLVMLGGRERTRDELGALLNAAGFTLQKVIPTVGLFAVLVATKNLHIS